MRLKKAFQSIIFTIGICVVLSGCQAKGKAEENSSATEEYTETADTEKETLFSETEKTTTETTGTTTETEETTTATKVSDSSEIANSKEYEYPVIITPTLTSNIEFAIDSEDIFCIFNGEKYGYITKSGEEITDYIYDAAFPFSDGLACVMIDGKYGFIDNTGKECIPLIYDDAAPFHDELAYFAIDGIYGFMTKDSSIAFYLDCDSVSSFQEGLAYFSTDGMYGYIDQTGQTVIEASYSDADYFKNGIAFITIDGYKGAIDTNGNVVIPIEYEQLERSGNYITASIGDETYYYDLNGKALSAKEYEDKINQQADTTSSENYTVKNEDNMFTVLNAAEEEIFSRECFYASHSIYGDYKNYVLEQYSDSEKAEQIILLEENSDVDLTDVLLKNSITPKKELYWNLLHGKETEILNTDGETATLQNFNLWNDFSYIKKAKFYGAGHSGNPILYYYEEPCLYYNFLFPMSDSAFYWLTDGEKKQLVTASECGGSLRGDYICLWKDPENGETLIGSSGAAGGFGGYSTYTSVYHYEAGKTEHALSYTWIQQDMANYDTNDLIENAHLFYDDNDMPLTQDSIQEAGYVNEYLVNDCRVSLEEYQEATQKYRMFELYR